MFAGLVLYNKVFFKDSQNMDELSDNSIHLVVTSPPYFNAPFDYPNLYKDYDEFITMLTNVVSEIARVLDEGRIAAFVIDDMLVNGEKYPITADLTKIAINEGLRYRDKIIWLKPEGYIRKSRRSGVLIQHPYPMYYYPDNIHETILIFQKGKYNYKKTDKGVKHLSAIDLETFQKEKWYLNVWQITNVVPAKNRLEKGIAAFPEEIPYRLIKLFSHVGETVLDPFAGSGTTLKVALDLHRNAIGYEINKDLEEIIQKKIETPTFQEIEKW